MIPIENLEWGVLTLKKREIAMLLILVSLMLIFNSTAHMANASEGNVTRYTALVLDLSGSMSGTPLTELQKASKNFCNKILSSADNNYIAIIGFGSRADVDSPFSNYIPDLEQAIDNMRDNGGTNVTAGINAASALFASSGVPDDAIKNVIIMSDGVPDNASSAIAAAQALWDDYNVYSIGFFHDLSGNTRIRAEEFLKSLQNSVQNSGYFYADDETELDFEFGEIAEDIVGGNYPIIFIPGIMGSDLYRYQVQTGMSEIAFYDAMVWLPLNPLKMWDGSNMSTFPLYVRLPEDQQKTSSRNYGPMNVFKTIIDRLCEAFPNREVYVFAYDWRLSNGIDGNAHRLKEFVDSITQTTEGKKVDIVAHSMGGLVASAYYNMDADKVTDHDLRSQRAMKNWVQIGVKGVNWLCGIEHLNNASQFL